MEESPFLPGQEKDRQERNDDDHQREEDRAPDLLGGFDDGRLASRPPWISRGRQMSVRVLDHHDRSVHQDADREGQSAERHDVGRDAQERQRQEGDDDRNRQDCDRYERRAKVEEEDQDDEGDDDHFLDQGPFQRGHGAFDQVAPVVGDLELDARREGGLDRGDLFLDRFDYAGDVLPRTHDYDSTDGLPLAVPLDDP